MVELNAAVASWLGSYLVMSTLLLGAVWIASRVFVRSLRLQETLWKCAMIVAITGSIASTVLRPRTKEPVVDRAIPQSGVSTANARQVSQSSEVRFVGERTRTPVSFLSTPIAPPAMSSWWISAVPALWLACAIIGCVRLVRGQRRLAASLGPRRLVTKSIFLHELSLAREAAGFQQPVCLTSSPRLLSPIAIGLSEIAISERVFESLSAPQRVSILAHEIAHLQRRDPAWRLFASIIIAVFFFQPLNWLARRKMVEIAEFLSDAAAARIKGHNIALAECLTQIAREISGVGAHAVALAGTPSLFLRRVQKLLVISSYPEPTAFARFSVIAPIFVVAALTPNVVFRKFEAAPSPQPVAVRPTLPRAPATRPEPVRATVPAARSDTIVSSEQPLMAPTELVHKHDENGKVLEATTLRTNRVVLARGPRLDRILPGGFLELRFTVRGRIERRVLMKGESDGSITRSYWQNESPAPYDADAEQWVAASISMLVKESSKF